MTLKSLTGEQKMESWDSLLNPSLIGIAVVDENFIYQQVNDQFCEMLEMTRAEILDHSFIDLTPSSLKELDRRNAELVKIGRQAHYVSPKVLKNAKGTQVEILMLVTGVYVQKLKRREFSHFVIQILTLKNNTQEERPSPLKLGISDWVDKKKVGTVVILGLLGALGYFCSEYLGWTWLKF